MHTYILREEREEQKEGEGGRKEVQLSSSAPELLNRGGGGSQAASEPGSERGTAIVEKLILEIHCCWHGRSGCSLIQSKLKSSLPWQAHSSH